MDAAGRTGKITCPWCGTEEIGLVCPKCTWPNRWLAAVTLTYRLAALAIVPLALAVATSWFSSLHEKATTELATHEKLLESYLGVAKTYSDYRHAADSITFLAAGNEDVSESELKTSVIDLIDAFDATGAKLTPFEDVQKRFTPEHQSVLGAIWGSCFTHPFFDMNNGFKKRIGSQLATCRQHTCPADAAKAVKVMLADIERPQCPSSDAHLYDQRIRKDYRNQTVDMGTIWNELDAIITAQDPLEPPSMARSFAQFFGMGNTHQLAWGKTPRPADGG